MTPEDRARAIVGEPRWREEERAWTVAMRATPDGHDLVRATIYVGAAEEEAARVCRDARQVVSAAIAAAARDVDPVRTRLEGILDSESSS